ncbi:MAG: helix-turn-helix transcriptional regulator, partial [Ruminiclostridium sp.]
DIAENRPISPISYKVKMYIEENFQKDLSLNDLSDIVYVSPYHLAHTFKDEMGVSPIQYLINCRIEAAKKLLQNSSKSVVEIASQVGYSNANYFNILFKKATGKSPGKFR